ncbi:MAG: NAD(+) diphosphatase [Anaerovoracaceae bacterium]
MIQDICPHIYHNEYRPVAPQPDSFLLFYDEGCVLASLHEEEVSGEKTGLTYPRFRHLGANAAAMAENAVYLFTIDDTAYFLTLDRPKLNASAAQFTMVSTGVFREAEPLYQAFAGITGQQLKNWYDSSRYCGRCGSELRHAEKERMLQCPVCGHTVYPKISPAVIVAVTDGNRLLLTKYSGRAYKRYALIAGFTEIGETVEETVRREVMEEVGLKVKNIRYYKSQPWSFSETLLMGFFCDLDGSDEIRLDTEELSVGVWMEREEVPEHSARISLTGEMIERFRQGME